MNINKDRLTAILGRKLPKTAVSYCTFRGDILFVNRRGRLMTRRLTKNEERELQQKGMLGTLGYSLA